METDLKKIARLGKQKEDENYKFRAFLKWQDSEHVDRIVHQLHEEVSSQIDCQECGNCCISLSTGVTEDEISRLAKIEKLSKEAFESKFVEWDDFENAKFLKDTPCRYLNCTSCSIYPNRPEECKSYPHTHKPDFISRTLGMISNYGICPIVFNVFERLKEEMNFKY